MNWHATFTYAWENKGTILAIGGLVISSGVKTLPIPGQPFNLYTWFYDWSHQFLNVTNTRLNTQPVVTPPQAVNKANENPTTTTKE